MISEPVLVQYQINDNHYSLDGYFNNLEGSFENLNRSRMVVKRLELCHYQSMEQIVTQTEVIERNFKENILKIVKTRFIWNHLYDKIEAH